MKRTERNNNKKIMKRNLAVSLLLLLIVALSVAGATQAWFTSGATLENVFTAGTVILSKPTASVGSPSQGSQVQVQNLNIEGDETIAPMVVAPTCKTVEWTFQNIGSKRAFVRVKPSAELRVHQDIYVAIKTTVGSETAWAEGDPIPGRGGGGPEWFYQYFTYSLGKYDSEVNSLQVMLISNNKYVGYVLIWDDGARIYLKFVAFPQYGGFKDIYLYAGLENVPGSVGFSQYPFKYNNLSDLAEFMVPGSEPYGLSYIYEYYNGPTIMVSDIVQPDPIILSPVLCSNSQSSWLLGNDDWYYYGTADGPTVVPSGEWVSVCFEYCYPINAEGSLTVSLEAEAIQVTNNAINEVWTTNPWVTQ